MAGLGVLPLAWAGPGTDPGAKAPLQFRMTEGSIENAFFQQGDVAAHLLLSSGDKPRILVAFPAGDSGAGIWFEPTVARVRWTLGPVTGQTRTVDGHPLNGIVAQATVTGDTLVIKDAVLGSIRVLRDYQLGQGYAAQVAATPGIVAAPELTERSVRWQRQRLDGAPGYAIALSTNDGRFVREDGHIVLHPDHAGEAVHLRIEAGTGETPLTPFTDLLNDQALPDERSHDALQFLSYREKFLAGSWRFDTYFGRDTLMSLRLLMPVLQPAAVDAGIGSVLARLSSDGQVAHEEGIGEFAVLQHLKEQGKPSVDPIYDYVMVDDDYMLPAVAAAWLLDDPRGRANAGAFLASKRGDQRQGDALVRNLLFVAHSSEAFAKQPVYSNLVSLKPDAKVGQWRDSNEGIGRGRYPYDVNAVWMPAALRAIGQFLDAGLLDDYTTPAQREQLRTAARSAGDWEQHASALFTVHLPKDRAAQQVRDYAKEIGVADAPALKALGDSALEFPAISLDAQGQPVPVLHSDEGFRLLFGKPDAAVLDRNVGNLMRPFPAGLMTDVGMVVANPAYAGHDVWSRFGNNAYHGTVVWAWQQAILAAGLKRQLARDDLPASTRTHLETAQAELWRGICAAGSMRTSELWSWSYANGHYRIEPFGAEGAHEDESNAAQLWSTVFLALPPPAGQSCR
ncbi:lipoprotein [Dyella japonica A8]|uniref:Lipoprotein n=2 Tax=Dyella japonica TaxID=231455 RepID=A0A075K366_9GAMM|nr:lipoprotein [Dyella japonica A8]